MTIAELADLAIGGYGAAAVAELGDEADGADLRQRVIDKYERVNP